MKSNVLAVVEHHVARHTDGHGRMTGHLKRNPAHLDIHSGVMPSCLLPTTRFDLSVKFLEGKNYVVSTQP